MNDKAMQILVIGSTVLMMVFNWLAATGILGGISTGAVSDKYEVVITPPGFAFAVWSAIYIGMIAFTIFQALPSKGQTFRAIRPVYIFSCAMNALWLYLWALEMMVFCQIVITALLVSLAHINIKLQGSGTSGDYWFVKAPFGLYFGWVTAATILNASIMLKSLGVDFGEAANINAGAALLIIAGVIAVTVRFKMRNYFYPIGIGWAMLTIALGHSGVKPVVFAAVAAFVACLIAAFSFIMDMQDSRTVRYD
jgi:hypothetical protein